ncbi:MAG: MATE family efflux transporter [Oscillospiraceae bacterium]|nr:MATE family efflux transporter [Oscillospiraceae bacterium]MDO5136926.1 MATE family efflux transporter [Oscillospiraceae bacterium]
MKLIGTKEFYKSVFHIAIPIMIQNVVTNSVSLVNNITVSNLGTESLAGVAIANSLISIYYLCIFGTISATGIFGAQYAGRKDYLGERFIFRLMITLSIVFSCAWMLFFMLAGKPMIGLFLHDSGDGTDLALTLSEAYRYIFAMSISFLPYSINSAYSEMLRENNRARIPMISSIVALVMSLVLNLILVPLLGVIGAATASVISRFVECIINVLWTHKYPEEVPFIYHAFDTLKVPAPLAKTVLIKGIPLIISETLWSVGETVITQSYSYHGVTAVAAINMAVTISSLVNTAFFSMGVAIGIILGNILGTGDMEKAKETDYKLLTLSFFIGIAVGAVLIGAGLVVPQIYTSQTAEVKNLARLFIWCEAAGAPFRAYGNGTYYTVRSGGDTVMTFLYDCGSIWFLSAATAYFLTHFTSLGVVTIYLAVKLVEGVKCLIGTYLVAKGKWLTNIVDAVET